MSVYDTVIITYAGDLDVESVKAEAGDIDTQGQITLSGALRHARATPAETRQTVLKGADSGRGALQLPEVDLPEPITATNASEEFIWMVSGPGGGFCALVDANKRYLSSPHTPQPNDEARGTFVRSTDGVTTALRREDTPIRYERMSALKYLDTMKARSVLPGLLAPRLRRMHIRRLPERRWRTDKPPEVAVAGPEATSFVEMVPVNGVFLPIVDSRTMAFGTRPQLVKARDSTVTVVDVDGYLFSADRADVQAIQAGSAVRYLMDMEHIEAPDLMVSLLKQTPGMADTGVGLPVSRPYLPKIDQSDEAAVLGWAAENVALVGHYLGVDHHEADAKLLDHADYLHGLALLAGAIELRNGNGLSVEVAKQVETCRQRLFMTLPLEHPALFGDQMRQFVPIKRELIHGGLN